MYMHPAMATGMSWNCEGTSTIEHVLVYWIAAFLGCYAGSKLDSVFHLPSPDGANADKKKAVEHEVTKGRGANVEKLNNNNNNNNVKNRKKQKATKRENNDNGKPRKKGLLKKNLWKAW